MNFIPEMSTDGTTVISRGRRPYDEGFLSQRIHITENPTEIFIKDLFPEDTGRFEIRDLNSNLELTVDLIVLGE